MFTTTTPDKELEVNTAKNYGQAKAAAMDAQAQNKRNKHLYTTEQQAFARDLYNKLVDAYIRCRVFQPNLRDTKITVKVAKPGLDRYTKAVTDLNDYADEKGITRTVTATGTLYEIDFTKVEL